MICLTASKQDPLWRFSLLYRTLESPDSSTYLQHDLDRLRDWSLDNSIVFNPLKCKILRISRKKSPSAIFPYQLDGNVLEHVSDIRDLGVTVSFDLQWTRHIEQITAKANRTLGLVKRVCRDVGDVRTKRLLYCTLVRPQWEYCSNLWSPFSAIHAVQRHLSLTTHHQTSPILTDLQYFIY